MLSMIDRNVARGGIRASILLRSFIYLGKSTGWLVLTSQRVIFSLTMSGKNISGYVLDDWLILILNIFKKVLHVLYWHGKSSKRISTLYMTDRVKESFLSLMLSTFWKILDIRISQKMKRRLSVILIQHSKWEVTSMLLKRAS